MGSWSLVVLHTARSVVQISETALGTVATSLAIGTNRTLARRRRERPRDSARWLTPRELELVDVLADLIVPSDQLGPGARDLKTVDRSAAETIDRLVAASPRRAVMYARGLLALDGLSRARHGKEFVELPRAEQVGLLELMDGLQRAWSRPRTLSARIRRRLAAIYHQWTGLHHAVRFFPVLVEDVFRTYYTNPVSWGWLGYDGPPMPAGYPQLDPA